MFRSLVAATTLLFAAAAPSFATPEAGITKPFLYKLEKNRKTSYLLGTIHNGVPLKELPSCVEAAMKASSSFVCEITETHALLSRAQQLILLTDPNAKELHEVLSREAWLTLQRRLLHFSVVSIKKLRPGTALMYLKNIQRRAVVKAAGPASMDDEILAFAGEKYPSVKIQGLETLLDRVLLVSPEDLENYLESSPAKDETRQTLEQILALYRAGDLEPFEKINFDNSVAERNKMWMPRIERLHRSYRAQFFFVGVSHLAGENGILSLAEKNGFTVTRVTTETDPCSLAIAK